MELAPAMKHSACICSFIFSRPADKRTADSGIIMRAMAISLMNSNGSTSSTSCSGVPFTFTSILIGTDSGCFGMLASSSSRFARSRRPSPARMTSTSNRFWGRKPSGLLSKRVLKLAGHHSLVRPAHSSEWTVSDFEMTVKDHGSNKLT